MKRTRVDGQMSRDEYMHTSAEDSSQAGLFNRATPNTLAMRKKVVATHIDRKTEFGRHIKALNAAFRQWFKAQVQDNDNNGLMEGAQDYVDYVTQLEDRYLKSYGEVLTFGSGDCGQLAHGVEEDDDLMVKFPRVVYSLRDKKVCIVACGGLHNAVVTEMGTVYTWGCNDDGSLGRPGEESAPLLVEGLAHCCVVNIACGDGQTLAVTASGTVYGWGCYKDKEGKKWFNPIEEGAPIRKQQDTPQLIEGLQGVTEVVCGSSFSLARCDDGNVFSWGLGECGELGRQVPPLKQGEDYNEANILKYHLSPGHMYGSLITPTGAIVQNSVPMRNAKALGAGAYHSLVVLINTSSMDEHASTLFTCGLNNYGQLGLGDYTNRAFLSPVVSAIESVSFAQVRGGVHHSMALTSEGALYAWGRGDSGQLGFVSSSLSSAGSSAPTPQLINVGNNEIITAMSCGGNHNLVLTASNAVYTWGYGEMLALGHGKDKDEQEPKKLNFCNNDQLISNITITQISGGGQHSAVIGKVVRA